MKSLLRAAILALVVAITLAGCTKVNQQSKRIVGVWNMTDMYLTNDDGAREDAPSEYVSYIFTFNDDQTGNMSNPNFFINVDITWQIDKDGLNIWTEDGTEKMPSFFNIDELTKSRLTLSKVYDDSIYTRCIYGFKKAE